MSGTVLTAPTEAVAAAAAASGGALTAAAAAASAQGTAAAAAAWRASETLAGRPVSLACLAVKELFCIAVLDIQRLGQVWVDTLGRLIAGNANVHRRPAGPPAHATRSQDAELAGAQWRRSSVL